MMEPGRVKVNILKILFQPSHPNHQRNRIHTNWKLLLGDKTQKQNQLLEYLHSYSIGFLKILAKFFVLSWPTFNSCSIWSIWTILPTTLSVPEIDIGFSVFSWQMYFPASDSCTRSMFSIQESLLSKVEENLSFCASMSGNTAMIPFCEWSQATWRIKMWKLMILLQFKDFMNNNVQLCVSNFDIVLKSFSLETFTLWLVVIVTGGGDEAVLE